MFRALLFFFFPYFWFPVGECCQFQGKVFSVKPIVALAVLCCSGMGEETLLRRRLIAHNGMS